MNLLYLSPNYPSYNVKFCAALKAAGVNVLGIGDSGDIPQELREALDDYYVVGDLHDYDGVYRAAAYLISRHGRIDKAVCHIPYWYEQLKQICYDYRIELLDCDPKELVSLAKAPQSVETVEFNPFLTLGAGRSFAKKCGYPLLFRPNDGWQQDQPMETSKGITKMVGTGELLKYSAEKFVTFEGLAVGGKIAALCAMVYPELPENAASSNGLFSFFTFAVSPDQFKICEDLIEAYKIKDSIFKFVFIPDGEKLLFLRAENVISGSFAIDFMKLCGIDICGLWVRSILGEEFGDTLSAEKSMVYISRRFDRSYAHTHPEILRKYADFLVNCGLSRESGSSAAGDYYYYAEISSPDQANEMIDYIQSDFPMYS